MLATDKPLWRVAGTTVARMAAEFAAAWSAESKASNSLVMCCQGFKNTPILRGEELGQRKLDIREGA